jgi:mono/diheme cytochrome c family protein
LAPELQHPVADFATWVLRKGRDTGQYPQPMVARSEAEISDQQLEEIWSWLSSFENPTSGQGLYEDFCANCHGADARGGRVGIPIFEEESDDIQKQVREGEDGSFAEIDSYMPARTAAELSNAELTLIAEYVAGL